MVRSPTSIGTTPGWSRDRSSPMVQGMNGSASRAVELPALYRSILRLVAQLEQTGERASADRLRRQAIRAYSTSWDLAQQRRLLEIEGRLRERLNARSQPPRARFHLGRAGPAALPADRAGARKGAPTG